MLKKLAQPEKVSIPEIQNLLKHYREDLAELKRALVKLRMNKRQRAKFEKKLESVIIKVEKKLDDVSNLSADTGCFAQKSIVNSVLTNADKTFARLMDQFHKVKEECKGM